MNKFDWQKYLNWLKTTLFLSGLKNGDAGGHEKKK